MLLTGDTVLVTPDQHWVAFQRSYPNHLPLSAAVVQTVAARVHALDVDRLYDNFGGRVAADGAACVARSAERHVRWVRGDFDHLTGTTG